MNNIVKKFGSITEYISYLENGKTQDGFRDESDGGSAEWSGTSSWAEAQELLAYGDKKLLEKVNKLGVSDARAKVSVTQKRKTFRACVVGAIPHVPNYVTGTPNNMIRIEETKTRKRVINLFYNAAFGCGVETKEIIETAARVMAAVILIEASGVHVNLYSGCISSKSRQLVAAIVKLKDSGQRLDVLKACYPMISPSWTRRQFIKFIGITEGVDKAFAHGYGSPSTTDREKQEVIAQAKLVDTTILNYYSLVGKTTEEIINFIKEQQK